MAKAVCMLCLMFGCTTYKPEGFGGGYNEMPLSQNAYLIKARGNAFASQNKTIAIAMVRAAVIAKEHGYDRFLILDQATYNDLSTYTTTGTATTNSTTSLTGNISGNRIRASGHTISKTSYDPPQVHTISKPRSEMVVFFVSKSDPQYDNALPVRSIIDRYGKTAGYKPAD